MKGEPTNYAGSFGLQWRTFAKTQLDSANGTAISRDRFFRITGWTRGQLRGKIVADFGCGMGRFSEIALSMDPHKLILIDYSDAVWVATENLHHDKRIESYQDSILDLASIPDASIDYGYCIGVLQHTPDPAKALGVLLKKIKPGGQLAIWAYERNWRTYLFRGKYFIRMVSKRLSPSLVLKIVPVWVGFWLPISSFFRSIGLTAISNLLPVANYSGQLPLSRSQLREWAILDTFDNWTPAYDLPLTRQDVENALDVSGARVEWNDRVAGVAAIITRI
ncbi:MAG TPA: methyltransferase domain-containing protein [Sedimentisphaerales bacterium]|nr:methyltransferase domain-containing protein [Sedimentisphaerales bacterium]